jgi:hypothetical protein
MMTGLRASFRQDLAGQGNSEQALLLGVVENTSAMTISTMRARMNAWITAPITMLATLGATAVLAQGTSTTLSPDEIAQVEAQIDRIEAQTLERLAAPPNNQVQQIELLGKSMLYDK